MSTSRWMKAVLTMEGAKVHGGRWFARINSATASFVHHSSFIIHHSSFVLSVLLVIGVVSHSAIGAESAISHAQSRVVKLYGAGGAAGLEAYQTGALISADGQVLTAWSHVLDTSTLTVVMDDGRRLSGKLVGADPKLDLAVLKVDLTDAPHFDLSKSPKSDDVGVGTRVFAVSNLYNVATGDEAASVQQGWIAAKTTLQARRGTYQTPYNGPVYVLDAVTNNPGAAGGVLVNRRGELLGVLGKELRNSETNAWLNYALPVDAIRDTVADLAAGKGPRRREERAAKPAQAHDLAALGLTLVSDALPRTPPYVDRVREDSPAAKAGLEPDDLIIMVGSRLASSCQQVAEEVGSVDRADPVKLTLMRGRQLVEATLEATGGAR